MAHKIDERARAEKKPVTVESVLDDILDIAPSVIPVKGAKRSGKWPKVQRDFLAKHPRCEVCGGKVGLNAHHEIPFEYGGPELDEANLITLCRGTFQCHLLFGHLGDFKFANPLVRSDAAQWRFRFQARHVLLRLLKPDQRKKR